MTVCVCVPNPQLTGTKLCLMERTSSRSSCLAFSFKGWRMLLWSSEKSLCCVYRRDRPFHLFIFYHLPISWVCDPSTSWGCCLFFGVWSESLKMSELRWSQLWGGGQKLVPDLQQVGDAWASCLWLDANSSWRGQWGSLLHALQWNTH